MLPNIKKVSKKKLKIATIKQQAHQYTNEDEKNQKYYFEQGSSLMDSKSYSQAIKKYQKCLQINPKNNKAYCNIGAAYKALGEFRQAKSAYANALSIQSNDYLTCYNYGNLNNHIGNYEQGRVLYQQCLTKIDQSKLSSKQADNIKKMKLHFNSLVNLAVCYQNQGKIDEAIRINDQIIKNYPSSQEGYFNKAMCLMTKIHDKKMKIFLRVRNQLCQSAKKQFQNALAINKNNVRSKLGVIQCKYLLGEDQQVFRDCVKQLQQLRNICNNQQEMEMLIKKQKYCLRKIEVLANNKNQVSSNYSTMSFQKNEPITKSRNQFYAQAESESEVNQSSNSILMNTQQQSPQKIIKDRSQHNGFEQQRQFWKLIDSQQYMLATKQAQKLPQGLERYEKIIVSKFLLCLSTNSLQIYNKIVKIYDQHFKKHNFDDIKDKITIYGHEVMAYLLRLQNKLSQSSLHYCYLIDFFCNIEKNQSLSRQQQIKVNFYCQQLSECFLLNHEKQQQIKGFQFYYKMIKQYKSKIIYKFLATVLIVNQQFEQFYKLVEQNSQINKDHLDIDLIILSSITKKQNQKCFQMIQQSLELLAIHHQKITLPPFIIDVFFLQICLLLNQYQNSTKQVNIQIIIQNILKIQHFTCVSKLSKQVIHHTVGNYYYSKDKYKQALSQYQKITRIISQTLPKIAICLMASNRASQSLTFYQRYIKINKYNNLIQTIYVIMRWIMQGKFISQQIKNVISVQKWQELRDNRIGIHVIKSLCNCISQGQQSLEVVAQKIHQALHNKNKNIKKQINLTVLTLNYSGVLSSPYQYYEKQDARQSIRSETFAQEVAKVYPNFKSNSKQDMFKWDMGSIDSKWKQRYSPFNLLKAGVNQTTGMMLSQQQFLERWDKIYQQTRQNLIQNYFMVKYQKQQVPHRIQTQIQKCRSFDLLCYKTFMRLIYKLDNIQKVEVSSQNYIKQRSLDFSKPYLNYQLKIQLTIQGSQKIPHDVLFLQQANQTLVNRMLLTNKYYCSRIKNSDSVILLNKESKIFSESLDLQQQNNNFLQKLSKISNVPVEKLRHSINFNKDSVFQVYKDLVFVNCHLSSKKQKNESQMALFKKFIIQAYKLYPEYKLIIGGDLNQRVTFEKQQFNLNYYPSDPSASTVKKKRTMMQPQRQKAEKLDQSSKDYLISPLEIISGKTIMISGKEISKLLPLLPNSEHPYDHFMICATFKYK